MVSHTLYKTKVGQFQKKKLPNSFISSKQVQRGFRIQAAIHIILDGALLGLLGTVAIMSSVALHSQYLWTKSFTKLETTRDLNRRLFEATSMLEGYLMKNQNLSKYLDPTQPEDLVYVDRPSSQNSRTLVKETFKRKFIERMSSYPIKTGY